MEREGIFQDTDGDGVPDYCDVTGNESRFSQESAKGTTGAMEMLRAMMSSVLNMSFNPIRSVEMENKIGSIQGANLQTTMAAAHRNYVTTHFDVRASGSEVIAQRRKYLFFKTKEVKKLNQIERFYKGAPKITPKLNTDSQGSGASKNR
jgi:hypothetical protein